MADDSIAIAESDNFVDKLDGVLRIDQSEQFTLYALQQSSWQTDLEKNLSEGHQDILLSSMDISAEQLEKLQNPIDLILGLLQSIRREVRVQNSETGVAVADESLLHHLDVDVDYVVVQPFPHTQPVHRLVGQLLHALESRCLQLSMTPVSVLPTLLYQ